MSHDKTEQTRVEVLNDAQGPISNLIVAHWQEIGSDQSKWDDSLSVNEYNASEHDNKALSDWFFNIDDVAEHNNYWIVVWFDFQGKAFQFLKDNSHGSFFKELEKEVMKGVDDLMGDLVDTLTDSDFGTKASKILNKAIDKIRENRGVGIVEDKINSDEKKMQITINCNAYHKGKTNCKDEVRFHSKNHDAKCTVYSYYENGNVCNS